MIKHFKHKGLEDFFLDGTKRGIQPKHAKKLADLLDQLEAAKAVEDMNFAGAFLHSLQGEMKGHYAVRVSGNWRMTFVFHESNAYAVDYIDYH